ncbi:MAG: PAS domain S-box protein [Deltaproteobacteria bacterium]|nr:PAS domain S-box protein [Deltaproteobacteria bacterium]
MGVALQAHAQNPAVSPAPDGKILVSATGNSFTPMNMLDEHGQLSGYAHDVTEAVLSTLGRKSEHIHQSGPERVLSWIQSGQVDFLHDITYQSGLEDRLDFTTPILITHDALIVLRERTELQSLSSLKDHAIACVSLSILPNESPNFLNSLLGNSCRIADSTQQSLDWLIAGKVDAVFAPLEFLNYLARTQGLESRFRILGTEMHTQYWTMAVRKGNQELLTQLNHALSLIRTRGELDRIHGKYFGEHHPVPQNIGYTGFAWAGAVLLALLAIGAARNRWGRLSGFSRFFAGKPPHGPSATPSGSFFAPGGYSIPEILDGTGLLLVTANTQGRIVQFNSACVRLSGYSPQEALGQLFWEFLVPAEEQPSLKSEVSKRFQPGAIPTPPEQQPPQTFTWQNRQGIRHPIAWSYIASHTATGTVEQVLAVGLVQPMPSAGLRGLKESERRHRAMVNALPHAVAIARVSDGGVLFANSHFQSLFRLGSTALASLRMGTLYLEYGTWEELARRILNQETLAPTERRMRSIHGGATLWVTQSLQLMDYLGEPAVMVSLYDTSHRKIQEMEQMYSQQVLGGILNLSLDAIITVDSHFKILKYNRGAETIFGYPALEMLGKPLNLLLPERYRHTHNTHIARFGQGALKSRHMGERIPLMGRHRDGREFDCEASISWQEVGGEKMYTVFLRDITERKEAEQTLRESEERYRNLIEDSPQGILICQGGRLIFANAEAVSTLGFASREDLLASNPLQGFQDPESGLPAHGVESIEPHSVQGSSSMREVIWRRQDGALIRMEMWVRPIRWNHAPAEQIILADITQRHRMENQMRQVERLNLTGQLASGVAHDFNSLLQIIRNYTDLALDKADSPSAIRESLEKVLKAVESGTTLTGQLLAFPRQETWRPRKVDLALLAKKVYSLLHRLFKGSQTLELAVPDSLGAVWGEQGMLEQVLMNLCLNARDAIGASGRVRLDGSDLGIDTLLNTSLGFPQDTHLILLSVSDTGTGIPLELQSRIFEPFFTTKPEGQGTGLGLSLTKDILERHQGKITLDSTPGQGSTFTLYFPAYRREPDPRSTPNQGVSGPTPGPQKNKIGAQATEKDKNTVLLAEDQDEVREVMAQVLSDSGFRVLQACNGLQALQLLKENKEGVSVLLLDVRMPDLNGREVYKQAKEIAPEIPTVFCTGHIDDLTMEQVLSDESVGLLYKPCSPGQVIAALRKALEQSLPTA